MLGSFYSLFFEIPEYVTDSFHLHYFFISYLYVKSILEVANHGHDIKGCEHQIICQR